MVVAGKAALREGSAVQVIGEKDAKAAQAAKAATATPAKPSAAQDDAGQDDATRAAR